MYMSSIGNIARCVFVRSMKSATCLPVWPSRTAVSTERRCRRRAPLGPLPARARSSISRTLMRDSATGLAGCRAMSDNYAAACASRTARDGSKCAHKRVHGEEDHGEGDFSQQGGLRALVQAGEAEVARQGEHVARRVSAGRAACMLIMVSSMGFLMTTWRRPQPG